MPDADLCAFVWTLRATQPLTIRNHMGRAAQQLCLHLIQQGNPYLAAQVHDHAHAAKPYATSGLLTPGSTDPVLGRVQRGQLVWLRLTGLQRAVTLALSEVAAQPPATIELDRDRWEVEGVTCQAADHPWAGSESYLALAYAHQQALPPRAIRLRFNSPTAFHSSGLNVPLPVTNLVFASLWRRWEELSGLQLPEDLAPFIDYFVALSRHDIASTSLSFKRGSKQVGFVGEATFAIMRSSNNLKRADPALADHLTAQHANLSRAVGMLAAFAFYGGVGIKTTQGMGMVGPTSPKT